MKSVPLGLSLPLGVDGLQCTQEGSTTAIYKHAHTHQYIDGAHTVSYYSIKEEIQLRRDFLHYLFIPWYDCISDLVGS